MLTLFPGHWIQACPTNDDPAYVNRPRVKRTTGIPRSFLKTVEKPTALANDGTVDETKQPAGVMVNADGEWVVAEPDQASWDQYQARAKVSAAAQEEAARGDKALQEKGLECPIDKRLFIEPVQTPCCQKTYCLGCITNTLLDNDLKCPHCATENVPVDDLTIDEQMVKRVRQYEQEQQAIQSLERTGSPKGGASEGKEAGRPETEKDTEAAAKPTVDASTRSQMPKKVSADSLKSEGASEASKDGPSRKRPADSPLANTHTPPRPGPAARQQGAPKSPPKTQKAAVPTSSVPLGMAEALGSIGQPVPASFMSMPMGMMPFMPIGNSPYNTMNLANPFMGGGGGPNWNPMWTGSFPQQPMGMNGGGGYANGTTNGAFTTPNMHLPMHNANKGPNGMGSNGYGRGSFPNQQRNHFGGSKANEEDGAYFRKPVNPHRHQARRNVNRPTDYREI